MTAKRQMVLAAATLLLLTTLAHGNARPEMASDGQPASARSSLQLAQQAASEKGFGDTPPTGDATSLPGGADSLRENYGDWAVECRLFETVRKCQMRQYQEDGTGRRVLSIGVSAPENGAARIAFLMPFGLNIADGIHVAMDDRILPQEGRFATCLADGCFVPMTFSGSDIDALLHAHALTVTGTVYGQNTKPSFSISLKGFSTALARLKALAGA